VPLKFNDYVIDEINGDTWGIPGVSVLVAPDLLGTSLPPATVGDHLTFVQGIGNYADLEVFVLPRDSGDISFAG
jgi:hypothetical protein